MKVTSLVDNVSNGRCEAEHGLSLHIELDCGKRILFDLGQGEMFAHNAAALGIDIAGVDMAVISHGHYDHGGGLESFLRLNSKAAVYLRRAALDPHFSVKTYGRKYIGLSESAVSAGQNSICCNEMQDKSRFVFCREIEYLPYGVILFSNPVTMFQEPPGNELLLNQYGGRDDFSHEQSMIICEGSNIVLFGGCAHRGLANILTAAQEIVSQRFCALAAKPSFDGVQADGLRPSSHGLVTAVFSGTHIAQGALADDGYVSGLAAALLNHHGVQYWTMHCTGEEGYHRLAVLMGSRISYLTAGTSVSLQSRE